MNPGLVKLLFLAGSSLKKELWIVFGVIALVLAMPLIAVLVIANSGVTAVASALATINPITHLVEIHDADGKVVSTLNLTTTWPVRGKVTTEFGAPDPPYQAHHTGIDISEQRGDPITPFTDGTVLKVDDNPSNATGFGKYVYVDHGNGITAYYGHMEQTNVKIGQQVKPGDTLGLEGDTGHAIGVHLHFEVRVSNIPVDPRTFIPGDPPL